MGEKDDFLERISLMEKETNNLAALYEGNKTHTGNVVRSLCESILKLSKTIVVMHNKIERAKFELNE